MVFFSTVLINIVLSSTDHQSNLQQRRRLRPHKRLKVHQAGWQQIPQVVQLSFRTSDQFDEHRMLADRTRSRGRVQGHGAVRRGHVRCDMRKQRVPLLEWLPLLRKDREVH